MKKYLPLILLAIAFVVLLITLAPYQRNNQSTAPTPIPLISFDNQFQQYRLKYPESWSSNNDKNHLVINKDNQVAIDISYVDIGNELFSDWLKRQDDNDHYYFQRGFYVFILSITGDVKNHQSEIDSIVNSFSLYSSDPVDFWPYTAFQDFNYGYEFGYPDYLKSIGDDDRLIIYEENSSRPVGFSFFFWPIGNEYPQEKGYIYRDTISNGYVYRFVFDAKAKSDYIDQIVSTLKTNVRY